MVLSYQSSSSGIQLGYLMVWKSQIFQYFVHVEVNSTFSTTSAVRKCFVSIRHNDLSDLTARIVSEVCKDTEIEPKLLPLPGEELHGRTRNRSNEARLGIRTGRFGIEVIRHFSM